MSPWIWIALALGAFLLLSLARSRSRSPEGLASIRQALDAGALLVDVRTPAEFGAHRLPGAVNVPLQAISQGQLKALGPKERALVLYCRSGARSAVAARTLRAAGYAQVYDLGAIGAWEQLPPKA